MADALQVYRWRIETGPSWSGPGPGSDSDSSFDAVEFEGTEKEANAKLNEMVEVWKKTYQDITDSDGWVHDSDRGTFRVSGSILRLE